MKLPTEKTKPNMDLADKAVFLYGAPKIGKTEFCSQMPDGLFVATEPGTDFIERYEVSIESWAQFKDLVTTLQQGSKFKAIIIDTIDQLCKVAGDAICAEHRQPSLFDFDHGKGWGLLNGALLTELGKLARLPSGLWLVSHAQQKTYETKTGKIDKQVPTLSDGLRRTILSLCDYILFIDYKVTPPKKPGEPKQISRVIRTKGTPYFEAGDRSKRLPEEIPFDWNTFLTTYEEAMKA